jgi:hypothetical protein
LTDWVKKALTRRRTDNTAVATVAATADEVPPSERLVLGVKFSITLTFSFTAIEIAHLALLHTWNSEVFAAITGLAGTITGILISQKSGSETRERKKCQRVRQQEEGCEALQQTRFA